MSEPAKQFDVNSDPTLSNAGITRVNAPPGYTHPGPSTSMGAFAVPVLPPRPELTVQPSYSMNSYGGIGGSYGLGGSYGMGGYGSYGYNGMGGYGMNSYGIGGMGNMAPYGNFNRYPGYGDIENRFIQLAEERSRPAFDSIQSVIGAVGSVAMMLENTFFALTSSFRAILGVAENFGRLRTLFAQFWTTFGVLRSINWLIRKLLVILGIRTESEFKAWADAVAATQAGSADPVQKRKGSSWPILLFFGVISAAPYIVLKMLSGLSNTINENVNDPSTWQNPLRAVAQHDFQAGSRQEISFRRNQVLSIAPQYLQGQLWNSGWLVGSADLRTAGYVPVNYIKIIRPQDKNEPRAAAPEAETENLNRPSQQGA